MKVNGRTAKPATPVGPGDRVQARIGDRTRVVEVTQVIQKRVGAAVAATCYIDHTPPAPPPPPPVAVRERGAGRPTKRDRRLIEQLRGRR